MNVTTNIKVSVLILFLIYQVCFAPPVYENPESSPKIQGEASMGGSADYTEYHRYLTEIVNALEADADFRVKLENAKEEDIQSGKIAEELEFASFHVRTQLDEIKRIELERLRHLTAEKKELENITENHSHVDSSNTHTFEIEDLKKLIAKTIEDLAEADKKRKQEFKQYELQKEYQKRKKLNETTGTDKETLEKEYKEREQKHKQHEKLHEPGHKAQLEEVWQDQDQMQQQFDPKMFFLLHDIDGNGLWDQNEVKALFIKELDKMYSAGAPEDDMRERAEEMERMREAMFEEDDLNEDGFIDFEEFLAQTKKNEFEEDHGWKALDERRLFTDEELDEFIRQFTLHGVNQDGAFSHDQNIYPNQILQNQQGPQHPDQPPEILNQVPQQAQKQLDLPQLANYEANGGQIDQPGNVQHQNQPHRQSNNQYEQQQQQQQFGEYQQNQQLNLQQQPPNLQQQEINQQNQQQQ